MKEATASQCHLHSSGESRRNKRPARLLPSRILHGDRKNETNKPMIRRFNGPPTNCSELSFLGYTLNGFYQVQDLSTSNKGANSEGDDGLETKAIYCTFKHPFGVPAVFFRKESYKRWCPFYL